MPPSVPSRTLAANAVPVGAQLCQTYDATEDWSESSNPAGTWSYREGANLLPHVDSWQQVLGGWEEAQPGWAESEDGNNRLPFFFLSNGSENFTRDYLATDLVVHSTDNANGSGNDTAELVWTSPFEGSVTIGGAAWMGRDIGRANDWKLFLDASEVSHGSLSSGDQYSRSSPFDFAAGSGGSQAIEGIPVNPGDQIRLVVVRTSESGDFVGLRMTVDCDSIVSRACGDPVGTSVPPITATDALFVLKSAVGQFPCDDCICDTNDSGSVTASTPL